MKFLGLNIFLLLNGYLLVAQQVDIYERPIQREPSHAFDVLHYRIDLDFEGAKRAFEGKTIITLRSLSDQLNRISLHAESYTVQKVQLLDEQTLTFSHKDGQLEIALQEPLGYDDTLSILINYGTDNFQVDPTQFGMGANYPLGLGFFEATDDQPFLFNAYSFPTGARHWFPCYDHPNDRASHETIITTQADHKVLANGILESVTKNKEGSITYHWRQSQPHPTYLYNFVSGPYVIVEDSFKDIPVNYWVYPNDEDKGLRSFHRTPEVLAFFEDYYGVKYPWDKYDQIIVPGIGGGAEATTATLIGVSTLHDERAEQDFPSHWLVAHEAAHHWFGDFISYRDWTETWLSESFATYSEYLYSNHLYGEEEGYLNLLNKRETYLNEAKNRYKRPIFFERWEFPNQNFDRHTYQKGALVLHMLKDYLGEANFKRVLQHFLATHAYQPVGTSDFLKSILEVTGQNMDWFLDQWIFRAGHPVLDIDYEWVNNQIIIKVNQIQDTSGDIPVFQMPVKINITTDQKTITKTIWLKQKENVYYFEAKQKPQLVRFDPENILLKEWTFQKSTKELMFQAQFSDIPGRLWAIQQLGDHLEEEGVTNLLTTIVEKEVFWALRREALQALSQEDSKAFRSLSLKAAKDKHSRVRAAAVKLLGDTKPENLHDLFRNTYENDSSYLVQAEAVRALGKLKLKADKSFFERVEKTTSPRNVLQRAASWALEQLH